MLSTLLLLMPAVTFADTRAEETDSIVYPEDVGGEPGDIVLIVSDKPKCWLKKWTHAAIYIGDYLGDGEENHQVVEATYHFREWDRVKRFKYLMIAVRSVLGCDMKDWEKNFLKSLQDRSYRGEVKFGEVRINDLQNDLIHEGKIVPKYKYGRVNVSKVKPDVTDREIGRLKRAAINYGINRSKPIWPLVGYTGRIDYNDIPNGSRPFDYISSWVNKSKQVEEYTLEQVWSDLSLARTLDYGYYCSELVWAAWMYASIHILGEDYPIDLDGDGEGAVLPWDIYKSDKIDWYYTYQRSSSDTTESDDTETVNATLIYPNQTINVTGVYDIVEINESYYLITINNETYPIETLVDYDFYLNFTSNEEQTSNSSSAENETTGNETTGNETANSEESSSEDNSNSDNSSSEDNSSNDQSNSEDNSDSNQDSSNEDDSSSNDEDQSSDTATGEQSSSEQSQNG